MVLSAEAGHVARMEEKRSAINILRGTSTRKKKKTLGRPRRRWVDNNGMDLIEIGISTKNCVDLAQDRGYWREPS